MTNIHPAYRLEDTFLRLHDTFWSIDSPEINNIGMIDVWGKVFFNDVDINYNIMYKRILGIQDVLDNLIEQIRMSRKMRETQKTPAINTVQCFYQFVDMRKIGRPAIGFRSECTVDACGRLGFLGHALEVECPEVSLQQEGLEEIVEELERIYADLDDQALPWLLSQRLRKKIKAILWRLKHPEWESLQEAYEAIGTLTLIADEMEKLCPDQEGKEKAHDIGNRLLERLKTTGQWISAGYSVVDGGNKLVSAVRPLLGL